MALLSKQLNTLARAYVGHLERKPLLTKAATAGVLLGLQEYLAQALSGTRATHPPKGSSLAPLPQDSPHLAVVKALGRRLDPKVVQMALYGFFLSGPLGHFLYELLGRALAKRKGPLVPVLMLLGANLLISPIQNAVYLMAMAFIAGQRHPAQLVTVVRQQLLRLQKISWALFPLVQLIANRYLRPPLWVPFFNVVGFVFGLYINTRAKLQAQRARKSRDNEPGDDAQS
ncbi:hypothetical protein H4R33_001780 [Dimargaris cristalligena]|uniref:Integral membrane protein n=1 Tax=Dimargaris cristalligena TaxID=215637 RepID=A0A4P9ZZ80_9FUNG|nr:hypothetical protein H4R33_001780 [Dimargaris cristalligena]RKP38110.1 hypothetical protein BJ085DRAFT_19202 [Dimargaris cristalligena]|eukprot:RKP38110.1 hypothetical protein BJ085DRAFT_19202 [Dimargaris cristalligena]